MFIRKTIFILLTLLISACSNTYPNKELTNQRFPSVIGTNLLKETVSLPEDLTHKPVVLLLGYKQDSQFDIDRWLIGLEMTETNIQALEIPTIQGLFPRMFKTQINEGMRRGIPKDLWAGVITVYKQGDKLQQFTGNEKPNNARVILLDEQGVIRYFYDQGFAVSALQGLRATIEKIKQ
ncbi:hypothetical protein [Thalassotalea sediminis]|uniref:hypothetical protein n=1 Tax=Thalassotalea sediminis TaxID=1759089 RepID=UPI002572C78C|nr:hypothetical protein [Thalassotalea sediminis]